MLAGVGKTALGVARIRAHETRRDDRLFDDPYAQAFVNASPGAFVSEGAAKSLGARFYLHAVVRTRFFDDYLLQAGCRQVVLLAAGLDTRAFRLDWPRPVRLFELDLPEVLAFKDGVLAGAVPRCERVVLPVDLRGDWAGELVDAGFDPGEATAWLAEGLLIYLSADEAGRMLTAVGELSAPGSRLAFEHAPGSALVHSARDMPAMRKYTAMWKGGLGAGAPEWLADHGWRPSSHEMAAVAASYGRQSAGRGRFLVADRV